MQQLGSSETFEQFAGKMRRAAAAGRAKESSPGRAFASAITSLTERVGSSALTAKIKGSLAIRTTGEKSFTGS